MAKQQETRLWYVSSSYLDAHFVNDGSCSFLGARIWPNGNKYVGEYKTHKRHGYGEFTFSNGSVFKGRFEDNRFAYGTYTWYVLLHHPSAVSLLSISND